MDVLLEAMECNDKVATESYNNTTGMLVAADDAKLGVDNDATVRNVLLHPSFTRKSCHRCGNIRKNCRKCLNCPHIICKNCVLKMAGMFKKDVFTPHSCPVCALRCCCSNKSSQCVNKYHCYRKCPVSRLNRRKQAPKSTAEYCFSAEMITQNAVKEFADLSGAASIAVESDYGNMRTRCGIPRDEMEESQDDPQTEVEESSGSPSPLLPSLSKSLNLMRESSTAFTITRRDCAMHDLKLPGFLSSGLLLGGEVQTVRSCRYPAVPFEARAARLSSDEKMTDAPSFYSV